MPTMAAQCAGEGRYRQHLPDSGAPAPMPRPRPSIHGTKSLARLWRWRTLMGSSQFLRAPTVGKTIGDQLDAVGLRWKSYQESLPLGPSTV